MTDHTPSTNPPIGWTDTDGTYHHAPGHEPAATDELRVAIESALADWEEILSLYNRGDRGRIEVVGAVLTLRHLRSLTNNDGGLS